MTSQSRPLLQSDEVIYERTKKWASFLMTITENETFNEYEVKDLHDHFGSEDEEGEQDLENKDKQLVRDNFEGSPSDDGFDVQNALNETLPIIEERKRNWKESGIDKVLQTFDLKAITEKVGSWLNSDKEQSINIISSLQDQSNTYNGESKISDDSLQSFDTAKYILSNRKVKSVSCTTTTIKRFRYVESQKRQKNCKKLSTMNEESRDSLENCIEQVETKKHFMKLDVNDFIQKKKPDIVQKRRYRSRKTRTDSLRKRSASSSSSSSNSSNLKNRYRKKYNRKPKLSSSSADNTLDLEIQKLEANKLKSKAENGNNINTTCFDPRNVVNSTALPKQKSHNLKECNQSPIAKKITRDSSSTNQPILGKKLFDIRHENKNQEDCESNNKTNSTCVKKKKFLIYSPKVFNLCHKSIKNGYFKLTKEHLRTILGERVSRRFIKLNSSQFPFSFEASSSVYFKLPSESESETSTDSNEDVLEMFDKQGKLIEEKTKA